MDITQLWRFYLVGLPFSILIETAVLLLGLSSRHPLSTRLFAGVWLTACTYPIVVLVLPLLIVGATNYALYLWVAETFAPVAECALFWMAFGTKEEWGRRSMVWDFTAIVLANLASFGGGLLLVRYAPEWVSQFG